MAINVNYAPQMDILANAAFGGGQTQEGIRQQNFGLQLEQTAQRERMQNADFGFRDYSMQFQAGENRRNLAAQLANRNFQQQQQIRAAERSQAFDQLGRERLASFNAGTRERMMHQEMQYQSHRDQQQFKRQQAMADLQAGLRVEAHRDMLTAEGQQRLSQMQMRQEKAREALTSLGVDPDSNHPLALDMVAQLNNLDSTNWMRYLAPEAPSIQEMFENGQVYHHEDSNTLAWIDPDGKMQTRTVASDPTKTTASITDSAGNTHALGFGEYKTIDGRLMGWDGKQIYDATPDQQQDDGLAYGQARVAAHAKLAGLTNQDGERLYTDSQINRYINESFAGGPGRQQQQAPQQQQTAPEPTFYSRQQINQLLEDGGGLDPSVLQSMPVIPSYATPEQIKSTLPPGTAFLTLDANGDIVRNSSGTVSVMFTPP